MFVTMALVQIFMWSISFAYCYIVWTTPVEIDPIRITYNLIVTVVLFISFVVLLWRFKSKPGKFYHESLIVISIIWGFIAFDYYCWFIGEYSQLGMIIPAVAILISLVLSASLGVAELIRNNAGKKDKNSEKYRYIFVSLLCFVGPAAAFPSFTSWIVDMNKDPARFTSGMCGYIDRYYYPGVTAKRWWSDETYRKMCCPGDNEAICNEFLILVAGNTEDPKKHIGKTKEKEKKAKKRNTPNSSTLGEYKNQEKAIGGVGVRKEPKEEPVAKGDSENTDLAP